MLGIPVSAAYGPTENTTFTRSHPVREPLSDRGAPSDGTGIVILDEQRDPAAHRMMVASDSPIHGYLRRPIAQALSAHHPAIRRTVPPRPHGTTLAASDWSPPTTNSSTTSPRWRLRAPRPRP